MHPALLLELKRLTPGKLRATINNTMNTMLEHWTRVSRQIGIYKLLMSNRSVALIGNAFYVRKVDHLVATY